jgi:hypothetical protein
LADVADAAGSDGHGAFLVTNTDADFDAFMEVPPWPAPLP